jgi:hypothetical protein
MVSFTAATVALIAAFTMATPIAAEGGFNFSPSLSLGLKRDAAQPENEFAACQAAVQTISPKPTYRVLANRQVEINGLPAICISQVNAHNQLPDIAEHNKWEGEVAVVNSTAIRTAGVGNKMTAYLETVAVQI